MTSGDIAIFILILLPIASLCFGLTLRLAIKPFIETLAGVLQQHRQGPEPTGELRAMERRLDGLTEAVEALTEKVDFDRRLIAGVAEGDGPPGV